MALQLLWVVVSVVGMILAGLGVYDLQMKLEKREYEKHFED